MRDGSFGSNGVHQHPFDRCVPAAGEVRRRRGQRKSAPASGVWADFCAETCKEALKANSSVYVTNR